MRTIKANLKAYISSYSSITPDDLITAEDQVIGERLFYWHFPPSEGYTEVGEATVTCVLYDNNTIIGNKVEVLKQQLKKTRADAEVSCNRIQEQINSLLCIEHKVAE